ncbi:hypothetical protein EC991_005633 [Linnemannia zychae]|nr:hypothetical protein EC991_005633 [Linnemannia zychae]
MSLKSQHIQNVHAESEQHLNEQMHIFKKLSKRYEDLDRKYMDLARTLQVTDHDRSTINKQLELVSSTIESLVIKGRGKGSANLNRVTAIQRFRDLGLLTGFPVQEDHLESFHLCFFMESAMMTVLVNRLFTRPLECIFDRSSEFESICSWMEGRGSRATARWRQELCILIAQDGEEMARRKVIEVNGAIVELNDLASSVFCNVDTSISDKIKGLCNIAFDLSYAMFGMESRVYPIPVELATPFDDNYMTMAKRSGPGESVSLVIVMKAAQPLILAAILAHINFAQSSPSLPNFEGKALITVFQQIDSTTKVDVEDVSGFGRTVLWPATWKVCTQDPKAGSPLDPNVVVKIGVVKKNEDCPELN